LHQGNIIDKLQNNPESLAIKKKQETEKDLLIKEIEALKETIKLIKESPTAQPTESVLTVNLNQIYRFSFCKSFCVCIFLFFV